MKIHNLGYPRMGAQRELKKANEQYWGGKINQQRLELLAKNICTENLLLQQKAGINYIPCNDFSFYDHMLDMSLMVNAIPERYFPVIENRANTELDLYFAMARGYQKDGLDITAMELTKWFDTNYHYIVPEFYRNQNFSFFSERVLHHFHHAKITLKNPPKVVLVGSVSYLLLGKEKEEGFHRLDLLDKLLPVYESILSKLEDRGAKWIQFDELCLVLNLSQKEKEAFKKAYKFLRKKFPFLNPHCYLLRMYR